MIISANDVTIHLRHELDERGEYNAFTSVIVDILVRGEKAGAISSVIVNRQRIPERMFLSATDGHSSEMQYVAVSIFEPRLGRTKLRSLRDGGSEDTFNFMYIEKMHVNDQYKQNGNSDVGACALRELLRHPYIKGRVDESISSCVYILDPHEAIEAKEKRAFREFEMRMDDMIVGADDQPQPETEESLGAKEEKNRRMDNYARIDANQFIRNGFYQDPAVASQGGNSDGFLVAAHGHFNRPLKSHSEAAAVQFYIAPPAIRPPLGKDAEILELTKRMCREENDATAANGRSFAYRADVSRLIREGGSLLRSNALHAACAINDSSIVRCILQMDPMTLEARDTHNATPLMIAAATAAGKSNINGFPRDQPVIDILVAAGARKGAVDSKNLTAYGTFKSYQKDYSQMMQALTGRPVQSESSRVIPGLAELESKLMPPRAGGPGTVADQTGGDSSEPGFINYKEEDYDY
eukprot:CAMPEP_0201876714 /NCGR_PEP_ID=MMETSP0902-20130614/8328_1 /ASSEMBLY_ACC=CAM_ASM_000551 /TAXON_ID=420261 /ORGANISM="Thalassiosira antarctica, Strain CCMP982" /LENGTH=466 /DNA_ID=CAMNT_0048404017 /DNA_START=38 /DNA_END=1436 /DNA_ORIENTATION=+